ncbi:lipopolysaccharide biosynthesis protein [Streptomyces sp. ACA25]|uniref:lipopolysaccharide biosynthesis protein n=1 Tax=Streptomyces sp. ACA25 TaxID=3022596 RepID=UPI002306E4B7|nr:lipopolysaccharide biosynthesis protein [Streptomyces sp. ACA25]MDB1087813.1 lipopolysaccharide biosynthesis protein [Streptomyces sp. ACA25]
MKDGTPREEHRGAPGHDEPDLLREQFRQLLRYRLLLAAGVLLGLLGGGYLGLSAGSTYIASSEVKVREPTSDPFTGRVLDRVAMGSERRTAVSDLVAGRAADAVGIPAARAGGLKRDLQVSNPPNTEVLRFSYTADAPETAARYANAFVSAYLEVRQEAADDTVERMAEALRTQREPLEERSAELEAEIAEAPEGTAAHQQATARQTLLLGQIGEINAAISSVTSLDTTGGVVITVATAPESPSGPGLGLLLGLGGAVGAGLGLLAAWLRLVFDPRVRSAGDVSRALRAPVLGELPRASREDPDQLLAEGRLAEEYRSVAFRLAYDETFAQRRRLLVVAPRGSIETPLAASVNLAAAFAEMGMDPLLIEADLRTPTLTDQLRHADGVRPGWAGASGRGESGWPAGVRVPIDAGESGIFDLVPGRRVRNVPRALTSAAASRLITHADDKGAVVVVLAPAVLSYADAIALIDRVDGVVVVCDPRDVRRDDLARVRELVVGAGGLLLGAVLHSWGAGSDRRADADAPSRARTPLRPGSTAGGTGTAGTARRVSPEGRAGSTRDISSETMGLRILDPSELEERNPRK